MNSPRRRKKGKRGEANGSSRPPAGGRAKAREATEDSGPVRVKEVDARGEKRGPREAVEEQPTNDPRLPELREISALPANESQATDSAEASAPSEEPEQRPTEAEDEDDGRQSGERPVDTESMRARESAAEPTNDRSLLMGIGIPPPPRMPSFTRIEPAERDIDTDPPLHSASLLDAPHSLRPMPESKPAGRPSATLLAFLAAFSAIIVTAGLVALRELGSDAPARGERVTAQQVEKIAAERAKSGAPLGSPRVEQLASPTEERAPSVAEPATNAVAGALPSAPSKLAVPAARAPGTRAKAPLGKGLSAKAAGKASKPDEPASTDEEGERMPAADEPLELPGNPYR